MRIFLRTFNNKINSKTGAPLAEGQYRGTPEWIIFQNILIECLKKLGHELDFVPESPFGNEFGMSYDKFIYVHRTIRDIASLNSRPEDNLYWMQMHFRELFTIDTNGWGADHSSSHLFNPLEVDQNVSTIFCREKSRQLLDSKLSKCDQSTTTGETPERFILVPVQIPRDYTIKHHSPITVRYFIESIQAWAIETETQVCFKMHPHNKGDQDLHRIIEEAQASSPFVRKVEGNIHELIQRASGLFVINSGTGFEGLVHGKPVCTFGDCDYRRATFNADIRRIKEACDFISSYKDEERAIGYQLVFWYWMRHAFDVNDPATPSRLTTYLQGVL